MGPSPDGCACTRDRQPLTLCRFAVDILWFTLYADPAYEGSNNLFGFPTTAAADPIGFVGVTALDPTTVVIRLKHPYVGMLAALADGVESCLPKALFGTMTPAEIAQSPENFWPTVTSGPFKMKERVGHDHLSVVRNPDYYQGPEKPYLDQITFKLLGGRTRPRPP